MAQFLGDIVFILELVTVAAGIFVFSIGKEKGSSLIKSSALILIIGGVLMAICSTFFYTKYFLQGDFDSVRPTRGMMWNMMNGRMGSGMMRGMGRGMMDLEDMDPEMQKRYLKLNQEMRDLHREMMDKYGPMGPR